MRSTAIAHGRARPAAKVGHSEIVRLREKAKTALGAKYDLRLFDDAVVKGGNVPMTVLGRNIDAHIAERAKA